MFKLSYKDLTDASTTTYKIFAQYHKSIEDTEALVRQKDFDIALTNYLQANKELDYQLFSCAVAWLIFSNMSISEIFSTIHKIEG